MTYQSAFYYLILAGIMGHLAVIAWMIPLHRRDLLRWVLILLSITNFVVIATGLLRDQSTDIISLRMLVAVVIMNIGAGGFLLYQLFRLLLLAKQHLRRREEEVMP